MTFTELIPKIQQLTRTEKIRLLQFLASELAKEEGITTIEEYASYPVVTPLNAFEAADTY